MNPFRKILQINEPLSGGRYAWIGLAAFAVKFSLDRLLATLGFHHSWGVMDYWAPNGNAFYLAGLYPQNRLFFASMLALALPFIAFGVVLTLRRLRTLELQEWLVFLFFIPYLNLPFFIFLSIPQNPEFPAPRVPAPNTRTGLGQWIPDSALGSALMAIGVMAAAGLALVAFDLKFFKLYGWGLFVFLPFLLGLGTAWIYSYHRPRTFVKCQVLAAAASTLLALMLMSVKIEGFICVLMAAPLWLTLAGLGAWVGWEIQSTRWQNVKPAGMLLLLILSMPFLMGAEYALHREPPLYEVRSSMLIHAPAARVWEHVVSFSELPPPKEWLFHTGVAYPMRARIYGRGPGAIRHCEFSTGAFIEPIQVWDAPRLLRFSVTTNPPPMQELSFYEHIDPPHLHGFLVSRQGQFRLIAQPDGTTLLEGTTWYVHHLWPAGYWRVWSDFIIHRIHLRVLRHIQHLSEE